MKLYKLTIVFSLTIFLFFESSGQKTYTLELAAKQKDVIRGHLDLGGVNPKGDSISVNSHYIEVNGKPLIPVIGEFHYSRYPSQYWEESILKMKAGGLNVIATYIFWNIHERKEGEFDWTGNLDLKKFISLCKKHNIYAIIRIGPFGHGEMRNGALPDWLYGKPFEVRSNDPDYLDYVKKLYGAIGGQVTGMFYQDGGPIIGIQLENEFQHSAAPWEITYPGSPKEYTVAHRDISVTHGGVSVSDQKNENAEYGAEHMKILKKIANDAGMSAPIYTATGWGNASIVQQGCIPVTAGYVYPFWAEPQPSPFYLYKDIHKNPDYSPVSFDPDLYPSMPAELGSGIMTTAFRRPTVEPESVEPLIVRTLGSGSNGIGYYMYHGGSTPVFDKFYSEESGGLPKINYDFQAPIGEFGDTRYHYRSLRLLHLFLESFGDKLGPMQTTLPSTNPTQPADATTLRYAVRSNKDAAFVFMHNFQDHLEYKDISDIQLKIKTSAETISIPEKGTFNLKKSTSAILPINLDLDGVLLKSATVQPLTKLNVNGITHFVFFSNEGMLPTLMFARGQTVKGENCKISRTANGIIAEGAEKNIFSVSAGGKKIVVIPRSMALQANRIGDRLYFSDADLLINGKAIDVISRRNNSPIVSFYPASTAGLNIQGAEVVKAASPSKLVSSFTVKFKPVTPTLQFERITTRKYALKSGASLNGLNDIILRITYKGDRSMAFFDGLLIADHFYYGKPWDIGLKRFIPKLKNQDMIFMFHPLEKNAPYLIDFASSEVPNFGSGNSFMEIEKAEFIPEYKAVITLIN